MDTVRENLSPQIHVDKKKYLCSAHFEKLCYTRLSLKDLAPEKSSVDSKEKRILERGSVPTIKDPPRALVAEQKESNRDQRAKQKVN